MAEPFKHGTLSMQAGHGYVIKLDQPVATLSLTARGECYVCALVPRGAGATPPTPTGAAVPAPGEQSAFVHLLAGESVDFGDVGRAASGDAGSALDVLQWILVWSVGSANLTWNAH